MQLASQASWIPTWSKTCLQTREVNPSAIQSKLESLAQPQAKNSQLTEAQLLGADMVVDQERPGQDQEDHSELAEMVNLNVLACL